MSVIDEKTVYLRMSPTYLEPETLLMVLRNLLRSAHDRDANGTAVAVMPAKADSLEQRVARVRA